MTDARPVFRYLSLGAGVQSSAMYVLAVRGDIPRPDVALFADTGDEPGWVYTYLNELRTFGRDVIPIQECRAARPLSAQFRQTDGHFSSIPAFTAGADGRVAMLRRQCTREHKIQPLEQTVRRLLGYRRGQWTRHDVRSQIGISTDEVTRMRPARTKWVTAEFPLIDLGVSRSDCYQILARAGLSTPKKSACVFCPFHNDAYWRELRDDHPAEFAKAVEVDRLMRYTTGAGNTSPIFLHRTLKPLADVQFAHEDQSDLFENECDGLCGV